MVCSLPGEWWHSKYLTFWPRWTLWGTPLRSTASAMHFLLPFLTWYGCYLPGHTASSFYPISSAFMALVQRLPKLLDGQIGKLSRKTRSSSVIYQLTINTSEGSRPSTFMANSKCTLNRPGLLWTNTILVNYVQSWLSFIHYYEAIYLFFIDFKCTWYYVKKVFFSVRKTLICFKLSNKFVQFPLKQPLFVAIIGIALIAWKSLQGQ